MWPPDLLEDLLTIPSVDVCLFATRMPVFEGRLSIHNQVAWMPQLGTSYTFTMVTHSTCPVTPVPVPYTHVST